MHFEFDYEAFEEALNPNTKVVLLTNPHNPAGKYLSREEIANISEILDKKAP
jgi:aspartate/methionine/tyrosine aminotransferase